MKYLFLFLEIFAPYEHVFFVAGMIREASIPYFECLSLRILPSQILSVRRALLLSDGAISIHADNMAIFFSQRTWAYAFCFIEIPWCSAGPSWSIVIVASLHFT